MLCGELEAYLEYSKNKKSDNSNARSTTSKQLKSEFEESIIEVPHDCEDSFEPIINPGQQPSFRISLLYCLDGRHCIQSPSGK